MGNFHSRLTTKQAQFGLVRHDSGIEIVFAQDASQSRQDGSMTRERRLYAQPDGGARHIGLY